MRLPRVIRTTLSPVQRILHTDVVPLHPPNPPPAPFPGTSWSPEAKLATQKAPASAPVEAQLTGAQLVQKREIIRESSRRSKASAGWRRKSTLQNNGCWFKNLSVCFRRTMPDPVEHMIAPSVSAASDNLTPSTPSTQMVLSDPWCTESSSRTTLLLLFLLLGIRSGTNFVFNSRSFIR